MQTIGCFREVFRIDGSSGDIKNCMNMQEEELHVHATDNHSDKYEN